jgi:hypothetical protein
MYHGQRTGAVPVLRASVPDAKAEEPLQQKDAVFGSSFPKIIAAMRIRAKWES